MQRKRHAQSCRYWKERGMMKDLRVVWCHLENDVGHEAAEICEGQTVKSYLGHVEEIELKSCEQIRDNGNVF